MGNGKVLIIIIIIIIIMVTETVHNINNKLERFKAVTENITIII